MIQPNSAAALSWVVRALKVKALKVKALKVRALKVRVLKVKALKVRVLKAVKAVKAVKALQLQALTIKAGGGGPLHNRTSNSLPDRGWPTGLRRAGP